MELHVAGGSISLKPWSDNPDNFGITDLTIGFVWAEDADGVRHLWRYESVFPSQSAIEDLWVSFLLHHIEIKTIWMHPDDFQAYHAAAFGAAIVTVPES